jgi:hypothetical protein
MKGLCDTFILRVWCKRLAHRRRGMLESMVRCTQENTFLHLGSMLQKDEDIDEDASHRIKVCRLKWHQASGPQKLKDKFYRNAIQPTMLYGAECWSIKRRHVQQLSVAEMCMLRWICSHTRRDRVRNDDIHEILGVAPVEEKLIQYRLRWFEHIQWWPWRHQFIAG